MLMKMGSGEKKIAVADYAGASSSRLLQRRKSAARTKTPPEKAGDSDRDAWTRQTGSGGSKLNS